jgi:AcrR family transcriptional regulator
METQTGRRTQAERREESRQAVLASAVRLFGEQGYANTALEQIAVDCGLTIRPIYHYFGNKKALFAAVNDVMEQRILDSMDSGRDMSSDSAILANWQAYLDLCDDSGFRQIVLVDSPNVLGRQRWATGPVTQKARSLFSAQGKANPSQKVRTELLSRMLMGALAEAAIAIAEADDVELARREAELLVQSLFANLAPSPPLAGAADD